MDQLIIETATASDLDDLLDLYTHLHPTDQRCPPDEAVELFERIGRIEGSAILVGKIDDQMVASCTLITIPNLTRGGRAYALIENVVTHSSWRQRGFGGALLQAAADLAWRHGCYKVMLMTGSKEPSTLLFYERAGFQQSKTGFQMRRDPGRR